MSPTLAELTPLPFQTALADHLERHEPAVWAMVAAPEAIERLAESTRLALLTQTVRLARESHPVVYQAADAAAEALGLQVPVTVYQGPAELGANAALFFVPEMAHVVLTGPLDERLDARELQALFGHELGHHLLWTRDDGRYWILDRFLDANLAHGASDVAQQVSAVRANLATELFADRAAAIAAGSVDPSIACLLKMHTGMADPDVAAYRQQVDDVLGPLDAEQPALVSEGDSHPEGFIRVRALDAWANGDEAQVEQLIRGPLRLDALDLLGQHTLERLTQRLLAYHLRQPWLRTEATVGQVRLIWPAISTSDYTTVDADVSAAIAAAGSALADYWCYLLLDLAVADRDLDEAGLVAGQATAEALGLRDTFDELAHKELKVTKRRLGELWRDHDALVAAATQAAARADRDSDSETDSQETHA